MGFGEIALLALAVASTSVTASKSYALEWLRDRISKLGRLPEKLIHCPYCLSHWFAAVGTALMYRGPILSFLVTVMAVVTLASFAAAGIIHYFLALDALEENE